MNGCIQLISHAADGKIEFNHAGREALSNIRHKLVVIAIAGPYRSGKSFILNSLLEKNMNGFGVGNDVRACTEGIWMRFQTIKNRHFLFLDVEGFGSSNRTNSEDAKLFALALLSSSLVLYNSFGVINENKINQLSLALSYCEILSSQLESISSTPKLVWLLRDFVLDLETQSGEKITATQYLENVLRDDSKTKNKEGFIKMRESIVSIFKERVCVTLPRPANDEEVLQRLNTLGIEELRPEFVKALSKVRKIIEKSEFKQYKGKELRGKDLLAMMEVFVDGINSEKIPNIPSAWESIVLNEYERITDTFIDEITKLKNAIQLRIPLEDKEIVACFKIIKDKADQMLIDCYFRNEELTYKSIESLTKIMEEEVHELLEMNSASCLEFNVGLLNKYFTPLFFAIENNEYQNNIDKLEVDWINIMEQFETLSKGSSKYLAISEFSRRNQHSDLGKTLNTVITEMNTQISELRQQEKMSQIDEYDSQNKTKEEIGTQILLNRYKMQLLNKQVKIIQRSVLKKL